MITKTWAPIAAALALSLPAVGLAQHAGHGAAPAAKPAATKGVRTIELAVTSEGFVPAEVKVKKGEKLRLVVTRKTDRTCATELVVKDYGIDQKLPLNQPVTIELTPTKAGTIRYACAMDMIAGTLVVE